MNTQQQGRMQSPSTSKLLQSATSTDPSMTIVSLAPSVQAAAAYNPAYLSQQQQQLQPQQQTKRKSFRSPWRINPNVMPTLHPVSGQDLSGMGVGGNNMHHMIPARQAQNALYVLSLLM